MLIFSVWVVFVICGTGHEFKHRWRGRPFWLSIIRSFRFQVKAKPFHGWEASLLRKVSSNVSNIAKLARNCGGKEAS